MNKISTKLTSAFAALTVLLTAAGCGSTDNTNVQTGADTTVSEAAPDQTEASGNNAETLSNPVAMTADGDVDMEVALSYQTDFDALLKQLDEKTVSEDHPVSDNTNPETLELYRWLKSIYGKQVLSAQQLSNDQDKDFLTYYYYTEDLPAMKGFDFIFKTTQFGDGADWTQMAIDWHTKSNGIVCFCWHWNVPCDIDDPENNATAFYTPGASDGQPSTTFDIAKAVTPGTKEYERAIHDIDLIAHELQRLEAAGVPVLWRPLHEASGAWFWWGIKDKEQLKEQCYQKLWYMIYDRLENYHKLTNLIWVWNGQTKNAEVHPNTYDIAGIDVYPNSENHTVLESDYNKLQKITAEGKMLALSECGYIPDSDELAANMDSVKWLYYMPWCSGGRGDGAFIYLDSTLVGIPLVNEKRMTADFLKKVMASDTVITWSELPDFEGTSRELPGRIQLALPDIEFQREKDAAKATD
ncbi:MAG: beta-mannanase [Ruminiclostridium sp.]|nr:beta-mannanase [Ruminiclostridium sp.]